MDSRCCLVSGDDDSDWSHDDARDSDMVSDEEDESDGKGYDDDEKITRLLTAGCKLKAVNLKECKAYLRKHGLRLSGSKSVCIERIVKHWRIKDGSGEAVYPRSSFVINCKGDVCKGDIVLFTQKVYQMYEKMKRRGKIIGKRTVAGEVIKESYGTAKQQHTFTIEVLWCKGIQKLPPLYPLLVKGRNLYRLMTLRQRWANEADRVKVLSEKHSRGAEARNVMRERKVKSGYGVKDGRVQKPGRVKTRKNEKDENLNPRFRKDIRSRQSHKNPTQLRNMNPPLHSYAPLPHAPQPYSPPRSYVPPPRSYAYSTKPNQRPPHDYYNRRPSSIAMHGQVSFNPHAVPVTHQIRPYENHHTHHASSNYGYNYDGVRDFDMMRSNRTGSGAYRQSEDIRRPYENHHSHHASSNNGYYYNGARDLDMVSHRREGNTYSYRPNYR